MEIVGVVKMLVECSKGCIVISLLVLVYLQMLGIYVKKGNIVLYQVLQKVLVVGYVSGEYVVFIKKYDFEFVVVVK